MNGQDYSTAKPIKEIPPGKPISSLLIMPERIGDKSMGYYDTDAMALYKELKKANVDVAYYTKQHNGLNQFNAHDPAIVKFFVGFFINDVPRAILYDCLKTYILTRFKKKPMPTTVRGKIYIASSTNKYETWREFEVTGNAADAIKIIDKIQELNSNELGNRRKDPKQ